jgi:hypothetical protein|tara:strand:+ start:50 stop:247 length:198 start_codon:yes stop_codon:yes gene_type:complete
MLATYNFKVAQELAWAVGVAASVYVLSAFVAADSVSNWREWAVVVGSGAARAAAGVVLAFLTKAR